MHANIACPQEAPKDGSLRPSFRHRRARDQQAIATRFYRFRVARASARRPTFLSRSGPRVVFCTDWLPERHDSLA
eukprot:1277892-Lingulodinium_polyedra.AAC.1